jgi:hypothetical protein
MDEQEYLKSEVIYMKSIIRNSGEIMSKIIDGWLAQKELNESLKETLQFYANPDNYHEDHDGTGIEADAGQRARDILKERL